MTDSTKLPIDSIKYTKQIKPIDQKIASAEKKNKILKQTAEQARIYGEKTPCGHSKTNGKNKTNRTKFKKQTALILY